MIVEIDVVVYDGETLTHALDELCEGFEVTALFLPGRVSGNGHRVVCVSGTPEQVARLLLKHNYSLAEHGLAENPS